MRKAIKLTERDLTRIVKKVINENITLGHTMTPEEFVKNNNGTKGTFEVKDGQLWLTLSSGGLMMYNMTCTPNQ